MKVCSKCKEQKDIINFDKKSDNKDGYNTMCKSCRRDNDKKRISIIEYIYIDKKICKSCNIEKDTKYFDKRKDSKDGYRNDCRDCVKLRLKNIIRDVNETKICKKCNIEKSSIDFPKYRNKCHKCFSEDDYYSKEERKQYNKKYNKLDKRKSKRNANIKERKKNDPIFKLRELIRTLTYSAYKRKGYTKKTRTYQIIGCSYEELKIYLESRFESWMTWDNHGIYDGIFNIGWDIDHIIPLSSATNEEELIKLSHYTNLRPLCSHINRDIKKDNI